MTHDEALTLLGSKFYKGNNGEIELIRVTNINSKNECKCYNYKTKEYEIKTPEGILSSYTRLINDGVLIFAIVETMVDEKSEVMTPDVIVTGFTGENFNTKNSPDIVCRQNIKDIFQAIYAASYNKNGEVNDQIVGTCLTKNSIPKGMNMEMITACDKVSFICTYNTYITDTVDTILHELMPTKRLKRFDTVLENCLLEYMKANKIVDMGQKEINGHCRNLETLLNENNFGYDFDSIFGITPIKTNLSNYLVTNHYEDGLEYQSLNNDMTNIFSKIFSIKFSKSIVVEYDHDIDLSELDPDTFFLVRDKSGKVYVVRYVREGYFMESDLATEDVRKAMENIAIINKYKGTKK